MIAAAGSGWAVPCGTSRSPIGARTPRRPDDSARQHGIRSLRCEKSGGPFARSRLRSSFRVLTPVSTCSTTRSFSGSVLRNASHVGSVTSPPSTRRTRGFATDTFRPPMTSCPWPYPYRQASRSICCYLFGPQSFSRSSSSSALSTLHARHDKLPKAVLQNHDHFHQQHHALLDESRGWSFRRSRHSGRMLLHGDSPFLATRSSIGGGPPSTIQRTAGQRPRRRETRLRCPR